LHWRLLTTEPVRTLAQARQIIGWYGVRWGIEVFHKVLKSGCAVEAVQLENAERLERYLAIKLVIAWQVLALTHLGRVQPTAAVRESKFTPGPFGQKDWMTEIWKAEPE
jgi:hypothetical protein